MSLKMPLETISRHLNVREILDRRSCFLFGPRQTGKSTLIRQQFEGCPTYKSRLRIAMML